MNKSGLSPGIQKSFYGIIFTCSFSAISLVLSGSLGLPFSVFYTQTAHFCDCAAPTVQPTGGSRAWRIINRVRPGFLSTTAPLNRGESFLFSQIRCLQFPVDIYIHCYLLCHRGATCGLKHEKMEEKRSREFLLLSGF